VRIKLKDILTESMIPVTYTEVSQLIGQFGKNNAQVAKLLDFKNEHLGETIQYEVCVNVKATAGSAKLEVDIT